MPRLLPEVTDEAGYRPWFAQVDPWLPAMKELCVRYQLKAESLERVHEGSAIVFRTQHTLIKLLPPFWRQELKMDLLGLQKAGGRLPVKVPEVLGSGELEDWGYLVSGQVPGYSLKSLWRKLEPATRVRLMLTLGELIAALQQLNTSGVPGDWKAFVASQQTGFALSQRRQGLAEAHIPEFEQALQQACLSLPENPPQVFLHSDLTDEHLLLEEKAGQWQITGLLDFGDLMVGAGLYDLAAPCALLTADQPELRQALVRGYGQDVSADQLMAVLLLHRFCHLPGLLKNRPIDPETFKNSYCML